MASKDVVKELQSVVESCLVERIKQGFDANAALTIDIAKQVAEQIEKRATEYTDQEVEKIANLIGGSDLKPLIDLLHTIRDLLDGNENTSDGFDVFNKLLADIADNKQTLINHTTSIGLIKATLEKYDATLSDHENRIKALEEAAKQGIDCEACQDSLLEAVSAAMEAANKAASKTLKKYMTSASKALSEGFADMLDPVELIGSVRITKKNIAKFKAHTSSKRAKKLQIKVVDTNAVETFKLKKDGSVTGKLQGTFENVLVNPIEMSLLDGEGNTVGEVLSVIPKYPKGTVVVEEAPTKTTDTPIEPEGDVDITPNDPV